MSNVILFPVASSPQKLKSCGCHVALEKQNQREKESLPYVLLCSLGDYVLRYQTMSSRPNSVY